MKYINGSSLGNSIQRWLIYCLCTGIAVTYTSTQNLTMADGQSIACVSWQVVVRVDFSAPRMTQIVAYKVAVRAVGLF